MTGNLSQGALCFVCNGPYSDEEWERRHSLHDKSCPNYKSDVHGEDYQVECDCENECHEGCCPICRPPWHVVFYHGQELPGTHEPGAPRGQYTREEMDIEWSPWYGAKRLKSCTAEEIVDLENEVYELVSTSLTEFIYIVDGWANHGEAEQIK